jgi:hypothetical protein
VPYVSRGRLLYRLAFVTAGATLDDRILEKRGQVARVHAELLAIDAQVPASDEVREHLDYMIAVLGHMVRKPDRERTFALADKIGTEHDPLTRLSRLTLLDIAIDEAVESGQSTRATRLRTTRDAIAIKE